MGLGQTVGQCGSHKPTAKTSIAALFPVGIDAGGGEGMGVHQSVHSEAMWGADVLRSCEHG